LAGKLLKLRFDLVVGSAKEMGMQGMQPHPLANYLGQNWLDLDKFG